MISVQFEFPTENHFVEFSDSGARTIRMTSHIMAMFVMFIMAIFIMVMFIMAMFVVTMFVVVMFAMATGDTVND